MLLCPVALFGWNHKPQSKKHRCAVCFFFFFEVFFYFVLFSFFQTEAVERGGGVKPARETVRMVRFGLGPPVHGAHACLCRRRGKWLAGVCWAGTREGLGHRLPQTRLLQAQIQNQLRPAQIFVLVVPSLSGRGPLRRRQLHYTAEAPKSHIKTRRCHKWQSNRANTSSSRKV